MLTATAMFMDSLENWVRAAREGNFVVAREHARNLVRNGELLVMHPDFRQSFLNHYCDVEPKDALVQLCQFLVCATDGRARVLKEWVENHKPIDQLDEPMGSN